MPSIKARLCGALRWETSSVLFTSYFDAQALSPKAHRKAGLGRISITLIIPGSPLSLAWSPLFLMVIWLQETFPAYGSGWGQYISPASHLQEISLPQISQQWCWLTAYRGSEGSQLNTTAPQSKTELLQDSSLHSLFWKQVNSSCFRL